MKKVLESTSIIKYIELNVSAYYKILKTLTKYILKCYK